MVSDTDAFLAEYMEVHEGTVPLSLPLNRRHQIVMASRLTPRRSRPNTVQLPSKTSAVKHRGDYSTVGHHIIRVRQCARIAWCAVSAPNRPARTPRGSPSPCISGSRSICAPTHRLPRWNCRHARLLRNPVKCFQIVQRNRTVTATGKKKALMPRLNI